jgi:nucleotide-binding universal stress UspA family protein
MKDRKILVPLDGSPISAQTLKTLIDLKGSIPSPVTLLNVLDLDSLSYRGFAETSFRDIEERARKEARQFIDGLKDVFAAAGVQVEAIVREGHVRETICEIADSGEYDLLVIGKHTDGELRNLLFDQVANYVVHHVKCPVLIV